MNDFLANYSIQRWLELSPQGYLEDTVYGHGPDETEPELVMENENLRVDAIRTTVQLVVGERCALAASSGLINSAPDYPSKTFLATQTLDEARHVEIFTRRLLDLGVKAAELESTIDHFANPHLVEFADVLLAKVDAGDFIAGVVGQNIVLEGMAFSVFEMMETANRQLNPKFAHVLSGTIADERRHVGFGENRIGSLIKEHPRKKPHIQKMQAEMTYHMLAAFAQVFEQGAAVMEEGRKMAAQAAEVEGWDRPSTEWHGTDLSSASIEDIEATLADTVLLEFKTRLERIGLEYQTPLVPA